MLGGLRPPGVAPSGPRAPGCVRVTMAGIPARGQLPGFRVSPAPRKTCAVVEELQSRLQETLDLLTPQELSKFRVILRKLDEEPRVSPLRLELEGGSASGLASLLAKHYYLSAPRVIAKVLQELRRADLLLCWQSAPAADGAGEWARGCGAAGWRWGDLRERGQGNRRPRGPRSG